ncbi:MAG: hypothetical protein V4573_18895, partial [Pseudomonadota bacterium]
DSADSRVKVGHRQALTARTAQLIYLDWAFSFVSSICEIAMRIMSTAVKKPAENLFSGGLFYCHLSYPAFGGEGSTRRLFIQICLQLAKANFA